MTTEDTIISPADMESLRKALDAASADCARHSLECARLNRVRWALTKHISDLSERYTKTRLNAFAEIAMEREANAAKIFKQAEALRIEKQQSMDGLSFLISWTIENQECQLLEAEITERRATAALYEAQACEMRGRMMQVLVEAGKHDPGIKVDTKNTRSERLMVQVRDIEKDIKSRRDSINAKLAESERNRALLAPGLLN